MDRDNTLLEEAYLSIFLEQNSTIQKHTQNNGKSFITLTVDAFCFTDPFWINDTEYYAAAYLDDIDVAQTPELDIEFNTDINDELDRMIIFMWNRQKTPQIHHYYTEMLKGGGSSYNNFDDLLDFKTIQSAIIRYPEKNPDFIKKYRFNPIYGSIIKELEQRLKKSAEKNAIKDLINARLRTE